MNSEWGRIADDGTVYVRTGDSERVIGSWQAGTPEEGLAFYTRRFADLAADVRLLEGRIGSASTDPGLVASAARKLAESLPSAAAIGDLAALQTRLQTVLERAAARREERLQVRAAGATAAAQRKQVLVDEATTLSGSSQWKQTSERFRAMVEEWKAIRGVDRGTDRALWEKFAAARRSFDGRRRSHFSELDHERSAAAGAKEALVGEAEKLSTSTDWTGTARGFRDLMNRWKASPRAGREQESQLWERFKAAQDTFFAARSAVLSERDSEQATNLEAKKALLGEAEGIDPVSDPAGAKRRLAAVQTRWDAVGHVPRDAMAGLDERMAAVERRVRDTGSAARVITVTDSPLIIRLRESVTKLEARLERARRAGDTSLAEETMESLSTQREWLAQAERSSR